MNLMPPILRLTKLPINFCPVINANRRELKKNELRIKEKNISENSRLFAGNKKRFVDNRQRGLIRNN